MERLQQIVAHLQPSNLSTESILNTSKGFANHVVDQASQVDWSNLPSKTAQYVSENPKSLLWGAVQVGTFLCPGVVTGPLMHVAGFTGAGPAAGSAAAWAQSHMAPVARQGVFAYVQSTAMKGYGRTVVEGVARGMVLAPRAAAGAWRYFRG
ncbi:hypothetical protein F9C07_5859 [Aspergillus flavus]|uniref:Uncharacterized protein n=1 Tax=Aspergillus flavus (strain ATCC 200026 / FGSC A1120 / IAM 13836 / NRRL 3357 / JCM 12722 / SRRC 167) TaxID=332952 RepID=A0A7G5KHX1_ASPFN|nr:uncharacterized protein G4B84_010892 [Aspergillus flavus NRRL3357]KOC10953.1 hypothetical protein AFLA70_17g006080 [Aspergillus flavus AF70]QMW47463.1 hypothetical protein G4B11_010942 [Aspergillus flavus]QMW35401.1 hypothetical protein G4B84_010892 [Aspergillus flavus NRRL3357]QRD91816.1 hypothetical protein F9C07_5859 [Aspergillus flavus]RAQ40594.1 hypothetical protein AFGD_008997 [Aspergillus flavus]